MSNATYQIGAAFWMPLWAVNAGADVFVQVTESIRKSADSQKKQVLVVNGKVKRFADAPIEEVYEVYKHMRGWLPHKPHLILAFTEIAQERGIDFDAMYEREKAMSNSHNDKLDLNEPVMKPLEAFQLWFWLFVAIAICSCCGFGVFAALIGE